MRHAQLACVERHDVVEDIRPQAARCTMTRGAALPSSKAKIVTASGAVDISSITSQGGPSFSIA